MALIAISVFRTPSSALLFLFGVILAVMRGGKVSELLVPHYSLFFWILSDFKGASLHTHRSALSSTPSLSSVLTLYLIWMRVSFLKVFLASYLLLAFIFLVTYHSSIETTTRRWEGGHLPLLGLCRVVGEPVPLRLSGRYNVDLPEGVNLVTPQWLDQRFGGDKPAHHGDLH